MGLELTSKLPDVGTTIFAVMSQLAAEHGAINLSQGFPDFDPPDALLGLVEHYLRAGANQYAPMPGVPLLRERLAGKTQSLYGRHVDPDEEITITVGATEALFSAIQAIVHPGDEVIVFDPAYDSYDPAVRLAGGGVRHIPLVAPDFHVDWQRVADTINDNTRLIVVNSPHNPTGSVLAAEDLANLADIVRDTSIAILSDEVYEHIVFDGLEHQSLHRHAELAERSLIVSSFGKTYHATGWKVGYVVAPPGMTREFRKVHQFVPYTVVTPIQHAYADFVAQAPEHYMSLPGFYQRKRDAFCALLEDSRFAYTPASGTYFQLVDYSALSDLPDVDYARHLTCEVGVAAIPVSVFCEAEFPGRFVRFCFAKDDATLARAAEQLCRI